MKHNYKRITALAGMTALLVSMPVSVYAGQIKSAYTANLSDVLGSVDVSALKQNSVVKGSNIVIDSDTDDWDDITARAANAAGVKLWKAAVSSDYSKLYFMYEGTVQTEWDYSYMGSNPAKITYADGTTGISDMIQFTGGKDGAQVKNSWYGDVENSEIATVNNAHGNTAGPYVVEAAIPMDFFSNSDFTITFAETTVDIKDIEVLDGQKVDRDETEAAYNGIVIDGEFDDWDAVKKYDAVCPNDAHNECISKTAMMFDGDYVYVYIRDGVSGSASGAGTHSNGKYSITTDLGNELVFQLDSKGYVNGVDGVDCRYVGNQWEIAIPADALPAYNKTISFGLYQSEPFVSGVANIRDDGSSDDKTIYDIKYDGLYGDWEYYPHTRINYATPGTQHNKVDAMGALFSDGNVVLGHAYTMMPEHLNEAGGEFTYALSIKFNDDYNQIIAPRFVTVDEQGNINWNPKTEDLSEGTYEFYMFDIGSWGTSKNINELNDADICYGKMTITVRSNRDECEFYIDLDKAAQKFGCDVSDFKQISAQFGRMGQQWINTAGASSGAWLGLFICIAATCGVVVYKKKKGSTQV